RPVLEQAFDDSGRALERGDSALALILSCSVIEAVITDALLYCGSRSAECGFIADSGFRIADSSRTADRGLIAACGAIADLSFESRIGAAERERLIRGGCARLPAV